MVARRRAAGTWRSESLKAMATEHMVELRLSGTL
jgi:hypothetical protein